MGTLVLLSHFFENLMDDDKLPQICIYTTQFLAESTDSIQTMQTFLYPSVTVGLSVVAGRDIEQRHSWESWGEGRVLVVLIGLVGL